jgi:hypothetical protein
MCFDVASGFDVAIGFDEVTAAARQFGRFRTEADILQDDEEVNRPPATGAAEKGQRRTWLFA